MKGLTERQERVLAYIAGFIEENHYPPAMRQIGAYFSITPRAVCDYVAALKKKGYVQVEDKCPRTLRLLRAAPDAAGGFLPVPVVGEVAAGARMLAWETPDRTIRLHKSQLKHPDAVHFALVVRGDSMTGAGIMDGDIAVILKQENARSGDIVVAEIDEGFTLKRYFKENSRIRLQPENPRYSPVYCRNIRIAGILTCVYRSY
ncbi:MAG: transcriptional repressor LexA [Spirochaetaceae bacterium]|nr:transcriptional repressor LexA [Spirochaetaceae bacterium]